MLDHDSLVGSEKTFAIQKVPTPAWAEICNCKPDDCFLYARTLGADCWDDVEAVAKEDEATTKDHTAGDTRKATMFAKWAVLGACYEDGEPFFTEADIAALLLRPLMPLVDLATATMTLNGVTRDKPDSKKEAASQDAPKEG